MFSSTRKIALLGAPSNGADCVFMSKRDKETLRDVFLGIYATLRNTEMAQSSKTLSSINVVAERMLRIFPKMSRAARLVRVGLLV